MASYVRLKISPPWVIFINKLQALFDGDPEIAFNVNWQGTEPSVVMSTNNPDKAAALVKILPTRKQYGNVTLKISVDCPTISNLAFPTAKELFETAFNKNPAFAYVVTTEGYWYPNFTYVVFKNVVVQFFCDNLNDPHGVVSTLYEAIAEEVFEDVEDAEFDPWSISFCTDVERNLGTPANWP